MGRLLELKEKLLEYQHQVRSNINSKSKIVKNIEKMSSKFYVGMLAFTIIGYLFFFFSRSIFVDDSPIIDSGTGAKSSKKIGDIYVQIVSKEINTSGYSEIVFEVEKDKINTTREYQAVVAEEKNGMQLTSNLMKIYDNYYVLQIEKIPLSWQNLVVDFGYVETGFSQLNLASNRKTFQATFHFDYRKMEENKILAKRKIDDYVIELTQKQINTVLKNKNRNQKNEEKLYEEIKKIELKMRENQEAISTQTGIEKESYEKANQQLKSQKEQLESNIAELQEERKVLEETRRNLIQKNLEAQSKRTDFS